MTMSNQVNHNIKYRADIDGLRAVAVLSVVIYHAFPGLLPGGFVGVDVFFVISGFLISTIIFKAMDQGSFSFSEFYARRIKRIFPALIVVSFSCYLAGWFLLFPDEFSQLGKHVFGGSSFISNFILLNESGYFDNSAETKPLLHLWSLGIEEQFYFIWPLLLALFSRGRTGFLYSLSIGFVISFILCLYKTKLDPSIAFYLPYTRFWELLAGGALAWFNLYASNRVKWQNKLSPALSFTGFLLLTLAFIIIDSKKQFPGYWAVLPVVASVLIISSGPDAFINKKLLSNKIVVWFGVISFPLYLWHWPVLSFLRIVNGQTPPAYERLIAVVLSVFLAWLTFSFVESKIRFRKDRKTIVALVSSVALIGFVGIYTYILSGIPSRPSIAGFVADRVQLVREPSTDDDCIKLVGGKKPSFDYCRYSNAHSSRNILVLGDSHAHAAFYGIAEYLKREGYNAILFANSSCPPFIGTHTGETDAQREFCTQRISQLLDEAGNVKNVEKIFVLTRGATYLRGTAFSSENDVNSSLIIGEKAFKDGAQKTIDKIRAISNNIYFVSENPELIFNPASCLSRPLNNQTVDCDVDRTSVDRRQREYMEILMSLRNVTVIDSRNAFCGPLSCSPFSKEGVLLYSDDNHLSKSGSEHQASSLLKDYLN